MIKFALGMLVGAAIMAMAFAIGTNAVKSPAPINVKHKIMERIV